ncbi:sodium-dependent transporter [candidate division KSB3 bacterium]|uniref:Sodium-dependent transporter n=1 Tax=candidate division KSB3 bacterium TaxID=2044937 RepID=A0A2G6KLF1_9BACT|nr:MAG: sodium-dependent transporter [candidate division KSB3 bacterium]
MVKNKSLFKSKWGFLLACVGSAVGMANVWGFPYKLGTNGGGAFLVAYLIFIALFSYVGLAAEYAIGRRAKTGTLGAYQNAWKSGGFEGIGKVIGWLPLAGSLCIAIGYAVILAYVLKGWSASITGSLMTVDSEAWFKSFAFVDFSVIPFHFVVIVGTLFTLTMGAESIEKTNKVMMPLFFILFVIMAVRIAFLPHALEGYKFLFFPKWSKLLEPMVWVAAMGQAFFSLSVTGSGMIVYGAYLSDKEDVVGAAKQTGFFDTLAALLAALVMIPACYAYSLDPAAGPGLLFVTLPTILQNMPGGQVFAIILFTAVAFGGISSLQNMLEVVAESLMNRFEGLRQKRVHVLLFLLVLCFGVGVNMNPITKWGPWMDFVSIYIIPIGATIGAVSWFWIAKKEDILSEINRGSSKRYGDTWHRIGRYLYVPAALILCIIALSMKIAF